MSQSNPKIIKSQFSTVLREQDTSVEIEIYRSECDTDWTLKVIEDDWAFVWEEKFPTDFQALNAALFVIRTKGIWAFVTADDENPTVH